MLTRLKKNLKKRHMQKNTINRYMRMSDPLPHSKATGSPIFFKSDIDGWLRRQMVERPSKKNKNLL